MTETPFARPQMTSGDKWDLKNEGQKWLGSMFLFYPKELKPQWKSGNNNYEPTDCIVADVIAVSGPDAGRAWIDTFILSKPLVAVLRDKLGDPVPGVLGRKTTQNGEGWCLIDAQTDQEWDQWVQMVAPIHQRYLAGQFQRASATPGPATPANPAMTAASPAPAPAAHDPWAGMNATPAANWNGSHGSQNVTHIPGYAGPAAAPAGTAAPTPPPAAPPTAATAAPNQDPNVGLLISKGLDPQQVLAMDPATRAAVAATY